MSDTQVTLRTRKFIRNALLGRKQMVVYALFSLFGLFRSRGGFFEIGMGLAVFEGEKLAD
jgi:hypothetical protein